MATIRASLKGRLRNTSLPKSHALFPLFEAVVNSIQSVDKAHVSMDGAEITVEIQRSEHLLSAQSEADRTSPVYSGPITGFVVIDNGEGFHDKNMESFETLDSDQKLRDGGRGIGRLLWLKAFDRVEVVSRYKDTQGMSKRRSFTFTEKAEISQHVVDENQDTRSGAEVRLLSFHDTYRNYAPKSMSAIAEDILEHCLWYYVRPLGAPRIRIVDGEEVIDLRSVFDDYILSSASPEEVAIKGHAFELRHLRLKASAKKEPQLYWCAANRMVLPESISGKVWGLRGRLKDSNGEFVYACYLMSRYLDENVRSERTAFNIPESNEGVLDESEPSLSDIRAATLVAIERHLLPTLEEVRREGRIRVENFVATKAPKYRPILKHIDEDQLHVDPQIGDRELELELHKHLANLESKILAEGQKVLAASPLENEDYGQRLREYLDKVDDIKKSDLAAYVSRRRVILDLFAQAIRLDREGKYAKEDLIHSLVMPLRTSSDDISSDAFNLWIIDERLAFHHYLASDKPISTMPITDSLSRKRPDLFALKMHEGPILVSEGDRLPLTSIVVVEFKRPMRNDADSTDNPLSQALKYLERVREGVVKTRSGRLVPGNQQIPGFCYVIADLTSTVQEACRFMQLQPTDDQTGYFGYNPHFKAYIEVMSFDRLLNTAHERNRAFFDQLGLPVANEDR